MAVSSDQLPCWQSTRRSPSPAAVELAGDRAAQRDGHLEQACLQHLALGGVDLHVIFLEPGTGPGQLASGVSHRQWQRDRSPARRRPCSSIS